MVSYRVVTDELIWREVEGEVVIVHALSSAYFGVNLSGTVLWTEMASTATSVADLANLLVQRFERDPALALEEATAFVDQAIDEGLVVVADDGDDSGVAEPRSGSGTRPTQPYEPPTVVRFGDLETLVLSGE